VKSWSDYVDDWAVDWDFRGDLRQPWHCGRTRRDRGLALRTPVVTYDAPGQYRILVRVVDLLGHATDRSVPWEVVA